MSKKYLIIIAGPTGVGKTAVAVEVARCLKSEIINADSRQIFKEMIIGTAVPKESELAAVRHHFVKHCSMHDVYNASTFEQEVITLLDRLYVDHDLMIMAGGSGMYIDAVCRGIDDLPTIEPGIRRKVQAFYQAEGLSGIQRQLKECDPVYFEKVDRNNPQRIMKALEVFEMTGRSYSSFLTGSTKQRDFETVYIGLDLPRQELHERINLRVDKMMEAGLLEEARSLYPFKHLNSLNTVGYKELFAYIDGHCKLSEAVENIKGHSRQYARRQLTWFHRNPSYTWFSPNNIQKILDFIRVRTTPTGSLNTQ